MGEIAEPHGKSYEGRDFYEEFKALSNCIHSSRPGDGGLPYRPFISARAEEEGKKDDRPPRSIAMAPEYPGVIIPPGEDVEMDVILYNKGKVAERSFWGLSLRI